MKKEDPRAGRHKPIEESDDEEELKKADVPISQELGGQFPSSSDTQGQQNAPVKEQKDLVIRANHTQQITTLLTNFNISLQANKNAGGALGRKNEDAGKTENKRKKEVKLVCKALFLNNNQIRSIKGLENILTFVMFNP